MTQAIINDAASLERQRQMLAAFEASAAEWQAKADRYRQMRAPACRIDAALTIAYDAQQAADRIRMRLVALSGYTLGDVAVSGPVTTVQAPTLAPQSVALAEACQTIDEPPEELVGLSDWLRRRLGSVFVWVTAARWQEIAYLLLASRPGGAR